jgi:hypothetical protein
MKKVLICTAVLGLALSSTSGVAAVISDGDFTNWSSFSFATDDPFTATPPPNTSSGSVSRSASGGNPGAFLAGSHTIFFGDTAWTGGLKTDFTYDPSIEGGINGIDFGGDLRTNAGAVAWQLVVEQAGTRYYSFPFGAYPTSAVWQAVERTGLTASDFDTNPWAGEGGQVPDGFMPDFSVGADPLMFGFMFGNRVFFGSATTTFDLDNFRLEIDSATVPVPPTAVLLLPLMFLARARRRNK